MNAAGQAMPQNQLVDGVLSARGADDPQYAVATVDGLLQAAIESGASDLHFHPTAGPLKLFWRIDGVLQSIGQIPAEVAANVVTRLKVMARLLTYETGIPQEGRIAAETGTCEIRVSTFPTIFGEKAAVRLLPGASEGLARLENLALPEEITARLKAALGQTSGAILIVGPAGSGKTTTAYACLREIAATSAAGRSIATLEDPVEAVIESAAQGQVNEAAGFDMHTGLRCLVRQDPEVIFIGEIRDPHSANVALQAALTGQLVITTFHAGDAAEALSRLADMGVPPYVLRSGVACVVAQRLVRRLCHCATPGRPDQTEALALDVTSLRLPTGCDECRGTGYSGRTAAAEMLSMDDPAVAQDVLAQVDAKTLAATAAENGMTTLWRRAVALVEAGATSPDEVRRIFGTIEPVSKPSADRR